MFPSVGVIALVPDVYEDFWMPRQQVMSRLARYFNVVWVDAPPQPNQWVRTAVRRAIKDAPDVPDGFQLYRPIVPTFYRPRAAVEAFERARLRRVHRRLAERGAKKIVYYLWRPRFAKALDYLPHDLSCYHIDDEYTFSTQEQPIPPQERALLERADQVFIHSPALMDKKGSVNPRTAFVPNGVDFARFSQPTSEPQDLAAVPHPRFGFVGVIQTTWDFDLLETLVARHPESSFVFVGPRGYLAEQEGTFDRIVAQPNVHWLGPKDRNELPAYMQHLDVCMMCYAVNEYTRYIYPLKLHEYLAGGRPVVASPIRTLQDFSHVIELARTPDEWSEALRRAAARPLADPNFAGMIRSTSTAS